MTQNTSSQLDFSNYPYSFVFKDAVEQVIRTIKARAQPNSQPRDQVGNPFNLSEDALDELLAVTSPLSDPDAMSEIELPEITDTLSDLSILELLKTDIGRDMMNQATRLVYKVEARLGKEKKRMFILKLVRSS